MFLNPLTLLMILKGVHVTSAAVWIGSIISVSLAVRIVRSILASSSVEVSAELGRRLRPLTRTSLYLTLGSGLLLAAQRGFLTALFTWPQSPTAAIALAKAVLGLMLVLLVEYHSILGNRLAGAGGTLGASAARRRIYYVGWSAVMVSFALAVLGTILRFR
ncbi:MAG: hypothetical protein QXD32_03430 [Nitrososphaerota archaeon]